MEKWVPKFKQQRKTNRFSQKRAQERDTKNITDLKFVEIEENKKSFSE